MVADVEVALTTDWGGDGMASQSLLILLMSWSLILRGETGLARADSLSSLSLGLRRREISTLEVWCQGWPHGWEEDDKLG